MDLLASQPVVIDHGGAVIKAGLAGEDRPKVLLPTVVGRPKHVRVMPGGALEGSSVFVGRKVEEHRGALVLSRPCAHGRVSDWADVEALWRHLFEDAACLRSSPEQHPVLLTVPPQSSREAREEAAQTLFESLRVPALHLAPTSTLALYATGRTTGLVLECGDGVTAATPVYEGYALPHAQVRTDLGGADATEAMAQLLRRAGVAMRTTAERETVRCIKEATAYVAASPLQAEAAARDGTAPAAEYRLPDGQRLTLGAERFRAAEVLFQPAVAGLEGPGAAGCVLAAVARSDLDLRAAQLGSIVLAGGSTACPGFAARLLADVRRGSPADAKVRVWAPSERKVLTWVGGSILASLSTFRKLWLTKEMWEEEGPAALHRGAVL